MWWSNGYKSSLWHQKVNCDFLGRHELQPNDTRQNDTEPNTNQQKDIQQNATLECHWEVILFGMTFSKMTLFRMKCFRLTKYRLTIIRITLLRITPLRITPLRITLLRITLFNITLLRITLPRNTLFRITFSRFDTQQSNAGCHSADKTQHNITDHYVILHKNNFQNREKWPIVFRDQEWPRS